MFFFKYKKKGNYLIQSVRMVCLCQILPDSGVKIKNNKNNVPDSYLIVTNDNNAIGISSKPSYYSFIIHTL